MSLLADCLKLFGFFGLLKCNLTTGIDLNRPLRRCCLEYSTFQRTFCSSGFGWSVESQRRVLVLVLAQQAPQNGQKLPGELLSHQFPLLMQLNLLSVSTEFCLIGFGLERLQLASSWQILR